MPQLELGVLPLSRDLKEGLKVAFLLSKKGGKRGRQRKIEMCLGRVRSFSENGVVVIEGITTPGLYNRPRGEIYEVHVDTRLEAFV